MILIRSIINYPLYLRTIIYQLDVKETLTLFDIKENFAFRIFLNCPTREFDETSSKRAFILRT